MSGFLLDTNIPSELTHPLPEPRVLQWLDAVDNDLVFLSAITLGEIRKGCDLLDVGKRRSQLENWLNNDVRIWFANRILPVDDAIAERWGALDAQRQRQGMPLNTADGLIAATALEHGLKLVTHNVADFRNLGLEVIDPWK